MGPTKSLLTWIPHTPGILPRVMTVVLERDPCWASAARIRRYCGSNLRRARVHTAQVRRCFRGRRRFANPAHGEVDSSATHPSTAHGARGPNRVPGFEGAAKGPLHPNFEQMAVSGLGQYLDRDLPSSGHVRRGLLMGRRSEIPRIPGYFTTTGPW